MSGKKRPDQLKVNRLGSQRGGYICDCGHHADTDDRWERHQKICELLRCLRHREGKGPSPLAPRRSANAILQSSNPAANDGHGYDAVTGFTSNGDSRQGLSPGVGSIPPSPLFASTHVGDSLGGAASQSRMHSGAVLPSSSPVSNPAPDDVVENETTPGRECDLLGDPPTPPSLPILLDRSDDLAFNDVNYPFSDDSDEMVGDDDGDEWANGEGMSDDGEGMGPFAAVNEDGERASGESARLDKLHVGLGGKVLEGGEAFCRLNTKAKNSEYYPYENLSAMLMYQLVHKYQFSEATLEGVLTILGTVHDGKGFEIKDLRGLSAKHFYSRRRVHHPLLEVVETKVPTSKDDQELVPVYDIPCNLLIDRRMQSPSFIDTCTTHPGGKLVREEAARNGLSSDHLFSLLELPKDNARSSNMHGVLARSSAFFGLDGLLGTQGNQKIHVADVAMCVVEGVARPCRILEMYWDCEEEAVLVSVRRFRRKAEVRDVTGRERRAGLERLWEEYGRGSKIVVHNEDVLALAEIYTLDELSS